MSDFWSDETLDALAACPPEALGWASAGYRSGLEDGFRNGYRAAETDMAAAWAVVAAAIRQGASTPRQVELQRIREGVDHGPCHARCDRCAQCAHSRSYWARGGRPFLGAAAEARTQRGAA